MRNTSQYKKAFSLVELSIVLIIVGLLVAGVSAGSKLIERARISSLITKINDVKSATTTFLAAYEEPPADFSNRQSFWGTTNGANGDGDGLIEFFAASGVVERNAFGDLSDANMMSMNNSYSSDAAMEQRHIFDILNISSANLYLDYGDVYHSSSAGGLSVSSTNNHIILNGASDTGMTTVNYGVLTPANAYSIDKKLDDGIPTSGKVRGLDGYVSSSYVTCDSSSTYALTTTSLACRMSFQISDN